MDYDTAMLVALPATFMILMAIELMLSSGRSMMAVPAWRWIGLAGLGLTLCVYVYGPLLLVPLLPPMAIIDLSGWGDFAALPFWMLTTFLAYWAHRIMHYFDVLWRAGHQLHHSVVRVDVASAMIFHPVDSFVQGVACALLSAGLLNVSAHAAAWGGLWGFAVGLYQHMDIRTPAWTGWFIQRPEAHILHHEKDVHARNFGDMPIWDRLFGTYGAPVDRHVELGFEPERARRWLAMLAFVDVNRATGRIKL